MNINYQKKLDAQLLRIGDEKEPPRLLLHSCCAPCSSYVLEYLSRFFCITVLYYNPNIYPTQEFGRRAEEQKRLIDQMDLPNSVAFLPVCEESGVFYDAVKGLEDTGEGGQRCYCCYRLRLRRAAELAKAQKYDYFTTTLSISPLKNAAWLNEIGEELARQYGTAYLYADFKKREGYKRSIELSRQFGLYRQDYCGCVFSKRERDCDTQRKEKNPSLLNHSEKKIESGINTVQTR